MESLNKQQLILLALLVSFVTSIATGIVTVALMDQAPQGVTQTINRVVEKTIERVVTEPARQTAAVVEKETVVVKADDLVIEAIEKNTRSVVRIKEVTGDGESRRQTFAGLGLIVSKDGHIAADIAVAYRKNDEAGNSIPESYIGVFPDGKIFPLNIVYSEQNAGIMFFQPLIQDREKGIVKFIPPAFGSLPLKLGQAVVAIGGDDTNSVSTGIIANFVERTAQKASEDGTAPQSAEKVLLAVKTDIRSTELVSGSVFLNLSGEVIGTNAGTAAVNRNTFLPIQKVLEALSKTPNSPN